MLNGLRHDAGACETTNGYLYVFGGGRKRHQALAVDEENMIERQNLNKPAKVFEILQVKGLQMPVCVSFVTEIADANVFLIFGQ